MKGTFQVGSNKSPINPNASKGNKEKSPVPFPSDLKVYTPPPHDKVHDAEKENTPNRRHSSTKKRTPNTRLYDDTISSANKKSPYFSPNAGRDVFASNGGIHGIMMGISPKGRTPGSISPKKSPSQVKRVTIPTVQEEKTVAPANPKLQTPKVKTSNKNNDFAALFAASQVNRGTIHAVQEEQPATPANPKFQAPKVKTSNKNSDFAAKFGAISLTKRPPFATPFHEESKVSIEATVEEQGLFGKQMAFLENILNLVAQGKNSNEISDDIKSEVITPLENSSDIIFQGFPPSLINLLKQKWRTEGKARIERISNPEERNNENSKLDYNVKKALRLLFPFCEGEYIYTDNTQVTSAPIGGKPQEKKKQTSSDLYITTRSIYRANPRDQKNVIDTAVQREFKAKMHGLLLDGSADVISEYSSSIEKCKSILANAWDDIVKESQQTTEIKLKEAEYQLLLAKRRAQNTFLLPSSDNVHNMPELPERRLQEREAYQYTIPRAALELNMLLLWLKTDEIYTNEELQSAKHSPVKENGEKTPAKVALGKKVIQPTTFNSSQKFALFRDALISLVSDIAENPLLLKTDPKMETLYIDKAKYVSKNIRGSDTAGQYKELNKNLAKIIYYLSPELPQDKITIYDTLGIVDSIFSTFFPDKDNLKADICKIIYERFTDQYRESLDKKIRSFEEDLDKTQSKLDIINGMHARFTVTKKRPNPNNPSLQEEYKEEVSKEKKDKVIKQFYSSQAQTMLAKSVDTIEKYTKESEGLTAYLEKARSDIQKLREITIAPYVSIFQLEDEKLVLQRLDSVDNQELRKTLEIDISYIPYNIKEDIISKVIYNLHRPVIEKVKEKAAELPFNDDIRSIIALDEQIGKINSDIKIADSNVTTTATEIKGLEVSIREEYKASRTISAKSAANIAKYNAILNSNISSSTVCKDISTEELATLEAMENFHSGLIAAEEEIRFYREQAGTLLSETLFKIETDGIKGIKKEKINRDENFEARAGSHEDNATYSGRITEASIKQFEDIRRKSKEVIIGDRMSNPHTKGQQQNSTDNTEIARAYYHSPRYELDTAEMKNTLCLYTQRHLITTTEATEALAEKDQVIGEKTKKIEKRENQLDKVLDITVNATKDLLSLREQYNALQIENQKLKKFEQFVNKLKSMPHLMAVLEREVKNSGQSKV